MRTLVALLGVAIAALFVAAAEQGPSELVLQVILLDSREKAEQIRLRIQAGEPFESLARENSVDPTAADGGNLGKVSVSGLRTDLREALKGLGPGQVTGVVPMPTGYMILKIVPEPEQLVVYVSGFEEVLHFFSKLPKPENYHQSLKTICELKRQAVSSAIQEMEGHRKAGPDWRQSMNAHHTLANLWAYQGNMAKAIEHFQEAYRIAETQGLKDYQLALQEKLAIAYLRQGEVENCLQNHNALSCIFPLRPEARHKLVTGSENAVTWFLKYLASNPADLEVKWLLNIAAMTLGKHPDGIPKDHLIPPAAFESADSIGRFLEIAPALGLTRRNTAGGAVMDDLDNDGRLDIAISVVDACEPMSYYHNNGDGTFADWTMRAGLSGQLGGINLNQTDYNNDGWLDLFVMRGGWEFPMRNSLLRNNRDGTFTDVTIEAGLAQPAYPTSTAAWGDFDNDGRVDLFVGNENAPGQLFRNKGDGAFVDVAKQAGVDRISYAKGAVWGDYDNDGFPDLYLSNFGQPNFLYHNNRDGTFTEVARQLGVEKPLFSFPAWFFDYDNDGWLDLFVSSYVRSVADIAAGYLKLPARGESIRLYRNTGKGTFADVTKEVGLDRISMAMGANFGDADNDGYLDIYLGTGSPSYGALVPNLMFRNQQGKRFVDITGSSGTGHLQKGHGIAFGDINNDGEQDLFLHVGGAVPGDTYGNALFKNPGQGNHWIGIRLVGVKTNRAAVGARIKVTVETEDRARRSIYRDVSSGGSFGASPFLQHLGLGRASRIESIEIQWPASKTRQTFRNVAPDQFLEIKEFAEDFRRLDRRSFVLPGSPGPHALH